MTRVLGAFLLAVLLMPGSARGAGDLTLRDLIELHRAGLGEELLIAVIEADGGPFKLSYAEIIDLKSDGLSERVIAALVRTGTRRAATLPGDSNQLPPAADAVPAVIVEQQVTQVAPSVVVIQSSDSYGTASRNRPGRHADRDDHDRHSSAQSQRAPATWVTSREDGRNISSGRAVSSGKPPATWVTPNDIRTAPPGFHPGNPHTPRRGEDPDRRHDQRRDTDRKPRP